jgi:peptide/nickel transport system substrate-binding protein
MRTTALCSVAFGVLISIGVSSHNAAAQKSNDTVRIPVTQPISGLSYYFAPSHETIFPQTAVQDGLVAFDEKALKFEPLLAKSWKRLDDRTIEFELRDDVKWHDGDVFDADDVASTVTWLVDPQTKLRFKPYWDWMDRVEKLSPTKIRLVSKEPAPYALARLATQTEILPDHIFSKLADKTQFGMAPIGTGMYRSVSVDKNKGFFLEKAPAYKHGGSARPVSNIRRVNLLFIPDTGTQIAQYLARETDVVYNIEFDQATSMAKAPGSAMTITEGMSWSYIALDAKGRSGVKPLEDQRVRRAIMMAIDRSSIEQLIVGDYKLQRKPEALCWRFQEGCDFSAALPAYDPDGAKRLLADAGFKEGFELELTALSVGSGKAIATVVSGQLSKIGIRASVDTISFTAYNKKQSDGKIQAMVSGWHAGGMPDIVGFSSFFFEPGYRDYHGDDELHGLARKADVTVDPSKRKEIARSMFDGMTQRAYAIPLAPSPMAFVHTKDLRIDGGSLHSFGTNVWNLNWQ